MLLQIIALLVYFAFLMFLAWFIVHFASRSYSSFFGAPYVPTNRREIKKILAEANLTPESRFLEPGCGDGRVVREAVHLYEVQGTGIDINPLLIRTARKKAHGLEGCRFMVGNVHDIDFRSFTVVYMYLFPELMALMLPRMEKELPKGSLVISHWFRLTQWDDKLEKIVHAGKHPTYFYRL